MQLLSRQQVYLIMTIELLKEHKLLLALYRLWREGRKKVRYEEIVVRAFTDYPSDFQLRGYPEFPDSVVVHKRLYDYRKKGMVTASSNMFSLTNHGVVEAERLQAIEKGGPSQPKPRHRFERNAEIEVERVKELESFRLFLAGKREEIIDSDLFEYLGVSVRSSKNEFIGKLETMRAVMAAVAGSGVEDPLLTGACEFHEFMMNRFASDIAFKSGRPVPFKRGG